MILFLLSLLLPFGLIFISTVLPVGAYIKRQSGYVLHLHHRFSGLKTDDERQNFFIKEGLSVLKISLLVGLVVAFIAMVFFLPSLYLAKNFTDELIYWFLCTLSSIAGYLIFWRRKR